MDNKCMTGENLMHLTVMINFIDFHIANSKSWLTTFNKDAISETLQDKDMIPNIEFHT